MTQPADHRAQAEIVDRLVRARAGGATGVSAGIEIHVQHAPTPPVPVLFPPMAYVVLQGGKRLLIGDREIAYGPRQLVAMSTDLPALVEVTGATPEVPYVALGMPLDRPVLASLVARMPPSPHDHRPDAVSVQAWPTSVLDPVLRLVRAMEDPVDARVLAAGIREEILYRLLRSPAGSFLRGVLAAMPTLDRIERATSWARQHLDHPIRVEDLAARASMGVTTFHRTFKDAVGVTPVRYVKDLRLHEARQLVASGGRTMESIAASVGYGSAAHFSRDYKRAFGVPPSQDAIRSVPDAAPGASARG